MVVKLKLKFVRSGGQSREREEEGRRRKNKERVVGKNKKDRGFERRDSQRERFIEERKRRR